MLRVDRYGSGWIGSKAVAPTSLRRLSHRVSNAVEGGHRASSPAASAVLPHLRAYDPLIVSPLLIVRPSKISGFPGTATALLPS